MATGNAHAVGTTKLFVTVWIWLLLLTILEIILAYFQVSLVMMITILMGLSLIKSVLIMAYFMHLKYERMSLVWTIIPALVILICLMFISFPDSVRLHEYLTR